MYLDIFVGIVLLVLIFLGIRNGIFVEALSILGVVASFFMSKKLTPIVVDKFLSKKIEAQYEFIAYIAVFIICWMLMTLLVNVLQRVFDGEKKGPLIRLFGGLIGLGRGLLISCILFLALNIIGGYVGEVKGYLKESKANETFLNFVPAISRFLPPIITEQLNKIKNQEIMEDKLSKLTY